ncbi:hypothetical protein COV24_00800 [candidate division WWE3 bacterium CG10_big_fil_rev_8_21_14_0_10_32_10]|uniref:Uncharacterized protein n=1 Tax=candidate division WWE3 bacterium CG10_big_fil_rev_8_21_14_0_10_32_10 TaxID=1975090 RepID=A0A2H0RBA2_UNCKA|nr:MAG: hypothetical protein COV24_00800 [candidate division WWE3 bacterium CG10_big_fil_rev_8_21_14_0_10_32_10]
MHLGNDDNKNNSNNDEDALITGFIEYHPKAELENQPSILNTPQTAKKTREESKKKNTPNIKALKNEIAPVTSKTRGKTNIGYVRVFKSSFIYILLFISFVALIFLLDPIELVHQKSDKKVISASNTVMKGLVDYVAKYNGFPWDFELYTNSQIGVSVFKNSTDLVQWIHPDNSLSLIGAGFLTKDFILNNKNSLYRMVTFYNSNQKEFKICFGPLSNLYKKQSSYTHYGDNSKGIQPYYCITHSFEADYPDILNNQPDYMMVK